MSDVELKEFETFDGVILHYNNVRLQKRWVSFRRRSTRIVGSMARERSGGLLDRVPYGADGRARSSGIMTG